MDCYTELKKYTTHEIDLDLAASTKEAKKQAEAYFTFKPSTKDAAKAIKLKDQGNKLFQSKEFEKAKEVYLQAVEEDSNLVSLFTNLAACEI